MSRRDRRLWDEARRRVEANCDIVEIGGETVAVHGERWLAGMRRRLKLADPA